jgi:hypothetical protein
MDLITKLFGADFGEASFTFALACILVAIAMTVDFICGVRKAVLRGDATTSSGLRQTVTKGVAYYGALLIAFCIDAIVHRSRVQMLGDGFFFGVPIATILATLIALAIEFVSVLEKADAKTKKNAKKTARIIKNALKDKKLTDALIDEIADRIKSKM